MRSRHSKIQFLVLIVVTVIILTAHSVFAGAAVKGAYLFNLSGFTGNVPLSWVQFSMDRERNEIYVCDTSEGVVRIFNEHGMEIYSFTGDDEDKELGNIYDVTVDEEGNIFVLSFKSDIKGSRHSIIVCNYRGEPVSTIDIKDLPSDFSKFSPDRIIYRKGDLYLADKGSMRVAVIGSDGRFKKGYDLASLLKLEEKKRQNTGIVGFSVDKEGNIFFTIPMFFQAYKLSPEGKVSSFGRPGSAPGRFNIVAGIVTDDKGYIYLTDTLKCVVMIFDKDFNFLTQFGYRGYGPGNLIAPRELVLDSRGRLYVAQSARRGVSVFQVKID